MAETKLKKTPLAIGQSALPVKVKRALPKAFVEHQFQPGHSGNPVGGRRSKTLLKRIEEMLDDRSVRGQGIRLDDCAEAFIGAMEQGSFIHAKEIIDRQEGRVPTRLADADGGKLKMYGSLPLEGEDAP